MTSSNRRRRRPCSASSRTTWLPTLRWRRSCSIRPSAAKQTQEILLESTEEHLAIKRVLADLLETRLDDDRFDAKLSVLKEEVDHHAREEEEDILFPKVRKMFSAEELDALGAEMLALFQSLMAKEPRKDVPAQTGRAARTRNLADPFSCRARESCGLARELLSWLRARARELAASLRSMSCPRPDLGPSCARSLEMLT